MPRISYSHLRLTTARSDLQRAWRAAGATWRDDARVQFEKEYIEDLLRVTATTVTAMTELTNLLKRVMQQCS